MQVVYLQNYYKLLLKFIGSSLWASKVTVADNPWHDQLSLLDSQDSIVQLVPLIKLPESILEIPISSNQIIKLRDNTSENVDPISYSVRIEMCQDLKYGILDISFKVMISYFLNGFVRDSPLSFERVYKKTCQDAMVQAPL